MPSLDKRRTAPAAKAGTGAPFLSSSIFETLDDVREYVSGSRIQCLVCGKYFRRLQFMHLALHGMTADDYRETFGIPWKTSLTSAPSRQASASKMTPERIEAFKQCKRVRGKGRRNSSLAVRNQWRQSAELGRYFSRQPVITACAKCGASVETTALCATQPIHCENCASPESLKTRAYYRRQQTKVSE